MSGKSVTSAWKSDQGVDVTLPVSIRCPEQQHELLPINASWMRNGSLQDEERKNLYLIGCAFANDSELLAPIPCWRISMSVAVETVTIDNIMFGLAEQP